MIKGSEYKKDSDFRSGWIPLAIIVVPDSSTADSIVYPTLKLRGGTSWLFAHEDSAARWSGSIVRIVNDRVEQESLAVEAVSNDELEPVKGARFLWNAGAEPMWVYCGGKCCHIEPPRQPKRPPSI